MAEITLTTAQRRAVTALVNEYQSDESPVRAKTIAAELGLETESVRRQMGHLRELDLVEGVRGPKGGYRPTDIAYSVLGRQPDEDPEPSVLARDFDRADAVVDEVRFTNVHHPDLCRAHLQFQQSLQEFDEGDTIAVGISPGTELLLAGVIDAIQPTDNVLIVDVARLETPEADANGDGRNHSASPVDESTSADD
ncbi:Rrf2 family transcriptional regulator [Haloterrigena salifodinae]|uniref:Rrf2 family transcriptional regulator n=1 Tax=Haloterrigena salifodinae TaxID=2675099 RepID=UPI000F864208|nr:Rrf2 family transcriptional regulator [Haloterrigena salifodinae]